MDTGDTLICQYYHKHHKNFYGDQFLAELMAMDDDRDVYQVKILENNNIVYLRRREIKKIIHNKIDVEELTDEIYDTLLHNVGLSIYHVPLNINRITNQFCDASQGEIVLEIANKMYKIKITQEKHNYFKEA